MDPAFEPLDPRPKETKAERLRRLIKFIEDDLPGGRDGILHIIGTDEGATYRFNGGAYEVRMAAVGATATSGYTDALRNWCNAARRKLLQLGAV